jgi:undecaprenyl diphosphate synthase
MLMKLFLDSMVREVSDLHRNQIRLRFIGDRSVLGGALTRSMQDAESLTASNSGLTLSVALAYGGRWDIAHACRLLAAEVAAGLLRPDEIDESRVAGRLALAGVPDPDLLIRTGASAISCCGISRTPSSISRKYSGPISPPLISTRH